MTFDFKNWFPVGFGPEKETALANGLQHGQVAALYGQIQTFNRFVRALTNIENEEDLAWYVAKEVVGKMGFVDCVYYLFSEDENCLVQRAAIADKNPHDRIISNPLHIPLGAGITGSVASSGRPILIDDVSKDGRYISDITQAGSEICVPILHGNKLIGVLDCEHAQKSAFSAAHMEALITVACLAGTKAGERRATLLARSQASQLIKKTSRIRYQQKELQKSLVEKENAKRAQTNFFDTVSHELRTPLNAIVGLSERLIKAEEKQLPLSKVGELAGHLNGAGSKLTALVNTMLESSAATVFAETGSSEITDLCTLLEACKCLAAAKAQAKKIEITVAVDPEVPAFAFNPFQLKKIIGNLLDNAVRYNPEHAPVTLTAMQRGTKVVITVSDHAGGFEAASLEKIQSLFCGDQFISEPNNCINTALSGGMWLGLTTVALLAKANHAQISVKTQKGVGSEITLSVNAISGGV